MKNPCNFDKAFNLAENIKERNRIRDVMQAQGFPAQPESPHKRADRVAIALICCAVAVAALAIIVRLWP